MEKNKVSLGGYYKHYKGGIYKVLYIATHTETGEKLAVYMAMKDGAIWARPLSMWSEMVGNEKRFKEMKLCSGFDEHVKEYG